METFNSIIEWYDNIPRDERIIYSYIKYLNNKKKANICFIPWNIVIYTSDKDYEQYKKEDKDRLSYKIEEKYNKISNEIGDKFYFIGETIKNTNAIYYSINSNKEKLEINKKKNYFIAKKNILYNKNLKNIINDCKKNNVKDIAFFISVADLKDDLFDNAKLHAILAYYNFDCKTILLINNFHIEIKEDLEDFLNEYLDLEEEISIYCPTFNDESFATFQMIEGFYELSNVNETGLCVVWQLFILEEWIFRENKKCDDSFEEFQDNMLKVSDEVKKEYKDIDEYLIKGVYAKALINNFLKGILNYRNELKKKLGKDYDRYIELKNKRNKNDSECVEYSMLFDKLYIENRLF